MANPTTQCHFVFETAAVLQRPQRPPVGPPTVFLLSIHFLAFKRIKTNHYQSFFVFQFFGGQRLTSINVGFFSMGTHSSLVGKSNWPNSNRKPSRKKNKQK